MSLSRLKRLIAQKPPIDRLQLAYEMGVDYVRNGADTKNCHFSLFATHGMTKEWERGRDDEQRKKEQL